MKEKKNTKADLSSQNSKVKIVHHYEKTLSEKDKNSPLLQREKQMLEKIANEMLRIDGFSPEQAEQLKKDVRNPIKLSMAPHLTDFQSITDIFEHSNTYTDVHFNSKALESFERLIHHDREERDLKNPAFIQIRNQHKLIQNSEMRFRIPKTTDVRQNVNNEDCMKTQPRVKHIYNYNIEQNKEFSYDFKKMVKEDEENTLEKQRMIKYIKLNPTNHQVRTRLIPKYVPPHVSIDKLPDFDVDITNWKPPVTKKSRRMFNRSKIDSDFTNYEAWRCFDRPVEDFTEKDQFITILLKPKHLIYRFGTTDEAVCEQDTGSYVFEDENLDMFILIDYKQTTESWGPNYEDEFYEV